LLGVKASDVEQRLGKPTHVEGLRWTYLTSADVFAVHLDDAQIGDRCATTGVDLTVFKR
jgi:hypothetical protein